MAGITCIRIKGIVSDEIKTNDDDTIVSFAIEGDLDYINYEIINKNIGIIIEETCYDNDTGYSSETGKIITIKSEVPITFAFNVSRTSMLIKNKIKNV